MLAQPEKARGFGGSHKKFRTTVDFDRRFVHRLAATANLEPVDFVPGTYFKKGLSPIYKLAALVSPITDMEVDHSRRTGVCGRNGASREGT